MKKLFITVLALLPQLLLAGAFGTRGGGDVLSSEFFSVLHRQWRFLALSADSKWIQVHQQLNQSQFLVRFTEETLTLENQPVQAINDRTNGIILVSQKAWKDLSSEQKENLVSHEVLSILGYEDNNYQLSQKLKKSIEDIKHSPFLYWKNKIQIMVKSELPAEFFFSVQAIFANKQRDTEELFCQAKLKSNKNSKLILTEIIPRKSFYFAPDVSYQSNTITLSFSSRNETNHLLVVCTNISWNPAGFQSPEDYTLEKVLDALEPILKTHASRL